MRWVLVTGASSGIGFELCRQFAADGYSIVLAARHKSELEEAADALEKEFGSLGVKTHVVVSDLAKPNGPRQLFNALKRKRIVLDALVNNAGFGYHGAFEKAKLKTDEAMVQLNVTAVVALTKLFLPQLTQRRGCLLNVASTAAFQPGPGMATYYATKAFALSFTEALAEELRGSVTVSALCPGPTRTNFDKASGAEDSILFNSPLVMDASDVARIGYAGLKKGKVVVVPGLANRLLAESVRFAPRRVVRKLVKRLNADRK